MGAMEPPQSAYPIPFPRPHSQPGTEHVATLADRVCLLLEQHGEPLEMTQVVSQILKLTSCPDPVQRRLVAELVDADPRLVWQAADLVGLASADWTSVAVGDAMFCVVDLETTGGSPGTSKITEIGAVRVQGLRVVERFSQLVDPERPIPAHITRITGIDDVMVRGMPPIAAALPAFMEFARDDVLVAHNAPFDLRFLNYERHRLLGTYFSQPWLDTLVLSRRLLGSRVERHDLGTLAGWAGTRVRPCHRALADAEATAEVLACIIEVMVEGNATTLGSAVAIGQPGGARLSHKLALVEDLPALPGVYLMRDADGGVVYVGNAMNLRRRVRGYFSPAGRHGRMIVRALEALDRVDHEVTGSGFEALLREHVLLTEMAPPCNRRGVGSRSRRYLCLTADQDVARIRAVSRASRAGGEHFGPLRSERTARLAAEALQMLLPLLPGGAAPDHPPDPDDAREATLACRRLLGDDAGTAASEMAALVTRAGDSGVLGADGAGQRMEALLEVIAELAALERAREVRCLLVERGCEPGTAVGFVVSGGRLAGTCAVRPGGAAAAAQEAIGILNASSPDSIPPPEALDEMSIVLRRVRERQGHPALIPLPAGQGEDDLASALARAHAAVVAEGTMDEEAVAAA